MPDLPERNGLWKKYALGAALVIIACAAATAVAAIHQVDRIAAAFHGDLPVRDLLAEADPGKPQTVLLVGSDKRAKGAVDHQSGSRSDTMILMRLDPSKKAIALMSLPRDLKVNIPGHGKDKLNTAYAEGGTRLLLKTVKQTTGLTINHVINVDFRGFREAVNEIGCVYTDVDRRYFNANSLAYATIDVQPGYQKLCGQKALDYVRFRHEDNDLVRAARQQDFIRQAKDQVGVRKIVEDREAFARLFAKYSETDIRGTTEVLRIFKLVAFSAGQPIREVHFRTRLGPSYVYSSRRQIEQTVEEFLSAEDSPVPRGRLGSTAPERQAVRRRRPLPKAPLGLETAKRFGEDQAIEASASVGFPVLYPRLRTRGAVYVDVPRTYLIEDPSKTRHQAYRMVIKKGAVGEYYGVQGTTWKDAPILSNPSEERKLGRRTFQLFFDGDRLRLVALRTPRAVYWVSNTLLLSLSNQQMLAIARSLQPVGRG